MPHRVVEVILFVVLCLCESSAATDAASATAAAAASAAADAPCPHVAFDLAQVFHVLGTLWSHT